MIQEKCVIDWITKLHNDLVLTLIVLFLYVNHKFVLVDFTPKTIGKFLWENEKEAHELACLLFIANPQFVFLEIMLRSFL